MRILKFAGRQLLDACPVILIFVIVFWIFSLGASQINGTERRISDAAYAYPREIVSYGLTYANSDDEVMATIQKWKDDRWGAQIGALRVLCAKDFTFVKSLGGDGTGQRICRLIR